MKQSGKVQRVRLGLHLAGAGWLLLAACTSATSPAPATQGATMEAKESAAMAENKEGAMEPATAPMESAGMAENKEGAMEPATMEKEGAMEA
ncbi:MAG: hypothetical protein HYY05_02405, partial [Chloroflexi bacterium]|nr:hypothetical protein [Chloroflexota bacterium]